MQIATAYTCSTDNQFAGYALWHKTHVTIYHIQLYVGYRAANDRRVEVLVYLEIGRTDCSLRGTIEVVHVETGLLQRQQFLTTSSQQS